MIFTIILLVVCFLFLYLYFTYRYSLEEIKEKKRIIREKNLDESYTLEFLEDLSVDKLESIQIHEDIDRILVDNYKYYLGKIKKIEKKREIISKFLLEVNTQEDFIILLINARKRKTYLSIDSLKLLGVE